MQKTINVALAFGMAGEMYDLTPRRVDAKEVAADVLIGGIAGVSADGKYGTMDSATYKTFAGIFVRPKEAINYGGSTPLEASVKVPAGCTVQVASMGRVKVTIPTGETWVAGDKLSVTQDFVLGKDGEPYISNVAKVVVGGAAGEVAVVEIG